MKKKTTVTVLRSAAVLAVAAAMLAMLAGCGFITITYPEDGTTAASGTTAAPGTSDAAATTDPPETVVFPDRQDEAKARLAALPEVRLSVRDLIIANSTATSAVIEPEEGDTLNSARTKRTESACKKYDISLTVARMDDGELLSAFVNAAKSGSYYADLAVIPASTAALYFNAGIAQDLRKLPFFTAATDAEKPEGAGIAASSCWFYCGDAVSDPDSLWALYFNRTLAGSEVSSGLYRRALGAGLTWEDVFTTVTSVGAADGVRSMLCGDSETFTFAADAVCASAGIDFVSHGMGEVPSVNFDEDKLNAAGSVIGRLAELLTAPDEGGRATFADGAGLFYLGTLSDMRSFYDKKAEWGILPLPRVSSDSEYTTLDSENRPVIVCVGGGSRTELDGAALAAFDAASGGWLDDAYADAALETCLRDNNSYLTLRATLSAVRKFDFSYIYSGATDELRGATYGAARKALTGGSLATAVKNDRNAANRELSRLFG